MTSTVAIPTIGRSPEVIQTVRDILAGAVLPDEILVSEQTQPPDPELARFLAAQGPRVRHLLTEPKGFIHNVNTLLREARGDIIVYIDDDIRAGPEFLARHLENYQDPAIHGVAGRVVQENGDRDPNTFTETGQFRRLAGGMTFRFNGLHRQRCVFAQGSNMSYRRATLLELGGFDAGYTGNAFFNETDLAFRVASKHPGGMVFDPTAALEHLCLPRGGTRVFDRSLYHAHTFRNGLRFLRKHSTLLAIALWIAKHLTLAAARAVHSRELSRLTQAFRALRDGLSQSL